MPVKWPFKILKGGEGCVLQHELNAFPQNKIKYLVMVNEFWIFCLITASFQISRQNHTLFWQKNLKNYWEEVEMIWKNISIWYFEPNKIPLRVILSEAIIMKKQQYFCFITNMKRLILELQKNICKFEFKLIKFELQKQSTVLKSWEELSKT